MVLDRVPEVLARHQVRVQVVVHDRVVLVRPGDAVDLETDVVRPIRPLGIETQVRPRAAPSPPGFRLPPSLEEVVVARNVDVLAQGVGDVGVDVVLRGAGRVVGGRLTAVDRPPGEERAFLVHFARPLPARLVKAVGAARRSRFWAMRGVVYDEERKQVDLRVPEVVALVAGAGQALRRDADTFGARRRLADVEQVEADRPLPLRIVAARRCPLRVPEVGRESAAGSRADPRTPRLHGPVEDAPRLAGRAPPTPRRRR